MLRSMTAYGRSFIDAPFGRITVELQSVNRKYLEAVVQLPAELKRFDADIRRWIAAKLWCGQITASVSVKFDKKPLFKITPNLALASQIVGAWKEIAAHLGLQFEQRFDVVQLVHEKDMLLYEADEEKQEKFRQDLKTALDGALENLIVMKCQEAEALRYDIEHRIASIQTMLEQIKELTVGSADKFREKLLFRLHDVLPLDCKSDERLLREVALYAEKADVTEEITRLSSHIGQFEALLNGRDGGVGKTMDFLLQEMNREAHTLSSKSSEYEVVRLVVEIKSALCKIREQIQNVE